MIDLNDLVDNDYPEIIRFAASVAIFSGILTLIIISIIFYNRIVKKRREEIHKIADETILETLGERIFIYDSVTEISEKELSKTLSVLNALKNKNEIFRKSMVRLLVYFQTNLTGSVGRIMNATYSRLKLREFSLKKLRSSLWFMKTQGLTEVQRMKDVMSLLEVNKLVNDPNQDVRVAAYVALFRLRAHNCFEIMSKEKEELSEWQQMMLEEGILNTMGLKIPSFKDLLRSDNRSLVLLSIKLIVDFKLIDDIPDLLSILEDQDDMTRLKIIEALGLLNAEKAETKLRDRYPFEPVKNKAAILISLGLIASGNSVQFIREKFMEAEHFLIIKSAAAAIISHPQDVSDEVTDSLQEEHIIQRGLLNHFAESLN